MEKETNRSFKAAAFGQSCALQGQPEAAVQVALRQTDERRASEAVFRIVLGAKLVQEVRIRLVLPWGLNVDPSLLKRIRACSA